MIYMILSGVIFAADTVIKWFAEKKLDGGRQHKRFGGRIIVQKAYNKGGALNTLDSNQQFVAGFSAALTFSVLMVQLMVLGKKGAHILKLGLSFILGGALSNVYDRIKRRYVVDYFSFNTKWTRLRNIVFNISDLFIFAGTVLAALYGILTGKDGE